MLLDKQNSAENAAASARRRKGLSQRALRIGKIVLKGDDSPARPFQALTAPSTLAR
jgi:hypothetical protein